MSVATSRTRPSRVFCAMCKSSPATGTRPRRSRLISCGAWASATRASRNSSAKRSWSARHPASMRSSARVSSLRITLDDVGCGLSKVGFRMNMSDHDAHAVICLTLHIAAPPERVFAAWVNPRDLERWAWGSLASNSRATLDLRPGGRLSVSTHRPDGQEWSFNGTIHEVTPHRRIVHSLEWDAPMGYEPADEVV